MKLLGTALLALILHLLFGWALTVLAGIFGGWWKGKGGWWIGGLGVGLSWSVLLAYNFVVAFDPMLRMMETVGGILGGIPSPGIALVSMMIGIFLGIIGGGLGTQIRLFYISQ